MHASVILKSLIVSLLEIIPSQIVVSLENQFWRVNHKEMVVSNERKSFKILDKSDQVNFFRLEKKRNSIATIVILILCSRNSMKNMSGAK